MNLLALAPGPTATGPGATPPATKIRHAAQEFESVLLQSLLEPLEKSFSTLPGPDDLSGADTYHYLGTQALASALSHSGGVGLAAMMVRTMLKPHGLAAKVPAHLADGSKQ